MRRKAKRIMALDVGFKRIGVAITDSAGYLARPLKTIKRTSNIETFQLIEEIITKNNIEKIVIGLPLSENGRETKMSTKIKKFAKKLKTYLLNNNKHVEFIMMDEYLSSEEARQIMLQNKSLSTNKIDAVAAAIILQSYLRQRETK